MEIKQLKFELSNRQKDGRKTKPPDVTYSCFLSEKEDLQRRYATAVKNERIISQHIQKLEQENQTLKTQVEDTRQVLQKEQVGLVCMSACVCVCVRACVCVGRCACACTCVLMHVYMYIYTFTCMHVYMLAYMHVYLHIRTSHIHIYFWQFINQIQCTDINLKVTSTSQH